MIAYLNILIFLAFLIVLVFVNIRMTLQVKKSKNTEANIIFILFVLGVDVLFVGMSGRHFDPSFLLEWDKIILASVGAISFISIIFAVMTKAKELKAKQLRTLLRLPVIGALLGIYFKVNIIIIGCLCLHLVLFVFYFKNKREYLYVFRQYAKGLFGLLIFLSLLHLKMGLLSLGGFLIFLIMNIQIINALKLKLNLSIEIGEQVELDTP